jgi:hypothetical protein
MGAGFVWFLFFFVLTLSPSMEHIKEVRSDLTYIKPREPQNETVTSSTHPACNSGIVRASCATPEH